jgi:membrane-associated phospholipid phosphatase
MRRTPPDDRPVVRTGRDALIGTAGVLLFSVCALPIHRTSASGAETAVFRAINDHTVVPFAVVWPFMQLGNFLVIPAAALAAAIFRRWRLAIGLTIGGTVAYLVAGDVVRRLIVRGRPPALLDHVHVRGSLARGLGFVSGHVAVATTLAVIAWPYLGRRGRWIVAVVPALVGLARVYVGAHMPLDVLGGAGLGLTVGSAVCLALGRPRGPRGRSPADLDTADAS